MHDDHDDELDASDPFLPSVQSNSPPRPVSESSNSPSRPLSQSPNRAPSVNLAKNQKLPPEPLPFQDLITANSTKAAVNDNVPTDSDSTPPPVPTTSSRGPQYIIVDVRYINMGADIKFNDDPFSTQLHGIMTADEFRRAIGSINNALYPCRATTLDHALLMMGPAMLPLIPWAIRSKKHKKQRKNIIKTAVSQFNSQNPHLSMRWDTKPLKMLTIWRRKDFERELNK